MAVETATNFTKDFICWATNMVTLLSSKCSSAFFNALNSLYLTPYFSMTENRHWNQRLLDETFNRRYKFKQYFRWQIRQTKSLNSITSITSKEGTSPTVLLHFSHVLTLFFYGNLITHLSCQTSHACRTPYEFKDTVVNDLPELCAAETKTNFSWSKHCRCETLWTKDATTRLDIWLVNN